MPLHRATVSGASGSLQNLHRVRVLVVIASFGEKNLEFLRKIIRDYRSMAMDVHLVVISEAPKKLDPGVEVVVGLPGRNPWSLPFAHKRIFVENIDRYDLFVYSEDDIGVKEQSIRAFLQATADLEPDEIAGYVRYEIGKDGSLSLPDVHGPPRLSGANRISQRGSRLLSRGHNGRTLCPQPDPLPLFCAGG